MKYLYSITFYLALIIKRLIFVIYEDIFNIYSSLKWFKNSNEHTSFSLKISEKNIENFKLHFSKFADIEEKRIQETIDYLLTLKFTKSKNRFINSDIADVDFENKYDYRIIPLVLINELKLKYIFEFGFNQGRLPYYLNCYFDDYKNTDTRYIGIDLNKRKGGLINVGNLNKNIEIKFQDIRSYLKGYKYTKNLENSLVISSTHEKLSEDFLFQFLEKNKIYPRVIVSDEVDNESAFKKFILKNSTLYKYSNFIFLDKNNFLKPLYIGVAIKN